MQQLSICTGAVIRFVLLSLWLVALLAPLKTQAEAPKQKVTKLGFISILSGDYSDTGQACAKAAQLAVKDFNSAHPDERVELLLEDDGADPKKGLSAYQKLRSVDKADIILPLSTFTIGSVRSIVQREKRLTLILGNEPYEPEDDYIYMISPAAIPSERALGAHAAKENPKGKILVLASANEAFYRFARAVQEGAGERAELVEIPAELNDFRSLVTVFKSKKPVAIVFNALPTDAAKILKAMRELNVTSALYFDESIANSLSDFQAILGDLSYLKDSGYMKLTSHTDEKYIQNFIKEFGTPPGMWSDYAYDMVSLALLLKDKSSDEARTWLNSNSYNGASGKIEFDDVGLRKPEYTISTLASEPRFVSAVSKTTPTK